MTIEKIDYDLCTGCGICFQTCPMDVIRIDETSKKPVIKYIDDCMCCDFCEEHCPQHAIYVSPEKHAPLMLSWY